MTQANPVLIDPTIPAKPLPLPPMPANITNEPMINDIPPTPGIETNSQVTPKELERPTIPILDNALPRIRNVLAGIASTPRHRVTLIIILGITSLMAVSVFFYLVLRRR